jgi:hypothetical protein
MVSIELPDDVYQRISEAAKQQGITPEEFIAASVSRVGKPVLADGPPANEQRFQSVAEAIAPHTVDSRAHTPDPKYRSAFGDLVDEKMAKQGFKRPEWPR